MGASGEESFDRVRRRVLWSMPAGLYLLGSRAGERRNLMTLSFATQVSVQPKLVGVGVQRSALTHELVAEGRAFALSFVGRDQREVVRRFVKPAVFDPASGTLNGYPITEARTGAPILKDALAYLDCELREAFETGDHTLFVGEVVAASVCSPEPGRLPVLRMEDTRMSYGG